jgi:hypothetical protein
MLVDLTGSIGMTAVEDGEEQNSGGVKEVSSLLKQKRSEFRAKP